MTSLASVRLFGYDLINIDPPWPYELYSEKGQAKSPMAHYKTMPLPEIAALPVGQWARGDCLLLCWGTFPLINKQIEIVEGWGFVYKTCFVWHKVFASGESAIGTGYRVRSMCEPIIVATIGRPRHTALPGLFKGERREHSRKPEKYFSVVEQCCPLLTFRADVFGRQSRPGWDIYGDESTKFDGVA